jgi:hypothetical protein
LTAAAAPAAGGGALFTKELEEALLDGKVDALVNCVKDMETKQPAGLRLCGITERGDPRDALVIATCVPTRPSSSSFSSSSSSSSYSSSSSHHHHRSIGTVALSGGSVLDSLLCNRVDRLTSRPRTRRRVVLS